MRSLFLAPTAVIGALLAAAAPAAATVQFFDFDGATGNAPSYTVTSAMGTSITVSALNVGNPNSLFLLSNMVWPSRSQRDVSRVSGAGIGVMGGANAQLDAYINRDGEALVLTATGPIGISALTLSWVDAEDTLSIFGVSRGFYSREDWISPLTWGPIRTGWAGAKVDPLQSSATAGNSNANFTRLVFSPPLPAFNSSSDSWFFPRFYTFIITTNGLGHGFFVRSIESNIVPEPASWALLITGFGLVGAAARRYRHSATGSA